MAALLPAPLPADSCLLLFFRYDEVQDDAHQRGEGDCAQLEGEAADREGQLAAAHAEYEDDGRDDEVALFVKVDFVDDELLEAVYRDAAVEEDAHAAEHRNWQGLEERAELAEQGEEHGDCAGEDEHEYRVDFRGGERTPRDSP